MTLDGRLPLPVGGGNLLPTPPSDVDVLIENLPFWLAIDKDNPYSRQTAQFRKEQIDTAPESGEQSLASWWQRSQMSFHTGSGLRFLDTEGRTAETDIDRTRFHDSRNINPWVPGVVTRLNGTSQVRPAAAGQQVWLETTVVAGVETLVKATPSGVETTTDGITWTSLSRGDTQPVAAFAIDGQFAYTASTAGVWQVPIAGGAAKQLYTGPLAGPLLLGWVKARLMLAVGPSVYELDVNNASASALPTAKLLHPVPGWQWCAFADTPNGIAAAGSAGLTSQVYKWEINTVNGDVVLTAGIVLLTMPPGEVIHSMTLYLGSMLLIGSNHGIRVSTFQSYYGTVVLGPLIQMVGDGVQMPVTALGTYDRFIFGGTQVDGYPALMRVDLGTPLDQAGHYPWATDLLAPADAPAGAVVNDIAFGQDGLKWFGVQGYGVVREGTAPDLTRDAWFETGRIRLTTVEDKNWCHCYVRGTVDQADPITVEVSTAHTGWVRAFVATANGDRFDLPVGKAEWAALRFHLGGNAQLNSYVLQALPGGPRQRIITLPLWCMDFQYTRSELRVGYDGWALARLAALESLEQLGSEITLKAPGLFPQAERVIIEQMQYVQIGDPGDRDSGTGGRIVIQFRTTT